MLLRSFHAAGDEEGQATVEAAFALPVLMVLFLLLLQPGIILYDRIVMEGAAAEGCRLIASSAQPGEAEENYIRRRLSAVPQTDIFHIHDQGCTWVITFDGNEDSQEVGVRISTEAMPLPLIGTAVRVLGLGGPHGNLQIEVEARMRTKDAWIESSPDGPRPSGWIPKEED